MVSGSWSTLNVECDSVCVVLEGESVPFIRGSALCAINGKNDVLGKESILKLAEILDVQPIPQRAEDEPFMLPIESVYSLKGVGTVVTGRVEKGRVKTGDAVEIIGCVRTLSGK